MSKLYTHPRSVKDRVFNAFISPGRFTKNPDVVRLPGGRMLLVYSDNDQHWSQETQVLTILKSDDDGRTWERFSVVDQADLRIGQERLVTPRLSLLSDGRLAVIIDHDDYGHFHEDQAPGNWIYWSHDGGTTWSKPCDYGIGGFEPDRIVELPDGTLTIVSHTLRRDSQEFAVILTVSTDGGDTWTLRGTVAHDGYFRYCEGAIVLMPDGSLACLMRENHSAGIPCFVSFSRDQGYNWSEPQRLPFALHRPYGKALPDGRVLVSGRHVNGPLGTYAWVGDLRAEAGTWQVGGPRTFHNASFAGDELRIVNAPEHECMYMLFPPQNSHSEASLQAVVRVSGDQALAPVAMMSLSNLDTISDVGGVCYIAPGGVSFTPDMKRHFQAVDMTAPHALRLTNEHGLLTLSVDGRVALSVCVFQRDVTATCFYGGNLKARTQFGGYGACGESFWTSVAYDVRNPTHPDVHWHFTAGDKTLPDRYQRERLIQIHANDFHEGHRPDHGYSSHLMLPDGRVFLVDYTNFGDPPGKSHLAAVYLTMKDLEMV